MVSDLTRLNNGCEDFIEVPSKKRRFCPHCLETVGYSTFYRHHDRLFDSSTNQWNLAPANLAASTTKQVDESASVLDFGESIVYKEAYLQGSEHRTNEGVSIVAISASVKEDLNQFAGFAGP